MARFPVFLAFALVFTSLMNTSTGDWEKTRSSDELLHNVDRDRTEREITPHQYVRFWALEGFDLEFHCPLNQRIGGVLFATYGYTFCFSDASSKVDAQCKGRMSCQIPVTKNWIRDDCHLSNFRKSLIAWFVCLPAGEVASVRWARAKWEKMMVMECPQNTRIVIGTTLFGYADCRDTVTEAVESVVQLCGGKNRCLFPVELATRGAYFPERCVKWKKILGVEYYCQTQ